MSDKLLKVINYALQLAGWILFIGIPLFTHRNEARFFESSSLIYFTIQHVLLMGFFYANYFLFIPTILSKKSFWVYVLYITGSIIIVLISIPVLTHLINHHHFRGLQFEPSLLVPILQILAVSSAWKLMEKYFAQKLREKKLTEEKRESDLKFLRSQINPHFLFNSLNNILALIRKSPKDAESAIFKLSEMMRYMLGCIERKTISIEDELVYIQNYIELQKIRLPHNFKLETQFLVHEKNLQIEPLILISFVENCFKHGIHGEESDYIKIQISQDQNQLTLYTENFLFENSNLREISSGIGLKNVKSRLELCYPGKYELTTLTKNHVYSSKLVLAI